MYYISGVEPYSRYVMLKLDTSNEFTVRSIEDENFCKVFDKEGLVNFVENLKDDILLGYNKGVSIGLGSIGGVVEITDSVCIDLYKQVEYIGKLSDDLAKKFEPFRFASQADYSKVFVGDNLSDDGNFVVNDMSDDNLIIKQGIFIGNVFAYLAFHWVCKDIIGVVTMNHSKRDNIALYGYKVKDVTKFKSIYAKSKIFN